MNTPSPISYQQPPTNASVCSANKVFPIFQAKILDISAQSPRSRMTRHTERHNSVLRVNKSMRRNGPERLPLKENKRPRIQIGKSLTQSTFHRIRYKSQETINIRGSARNPRCDIVRAGSKTTRRTQEGRPATLGGVIILFPLLRHLHQP